MNKAGLLIQLEDIDIFQRVLHETITIPPENKIFLMVHATQRERAGIIGLR